jgi:hypothetical protein
MSTHDLSAAKSPAAATEYPVGVTFDATFDAFAVTPTTPPNSEIRFHIAEGPRAHRAVRWERSR